MEFKFALTFCISLVVICVLFLIRSLYNDYLAYRKDRDVLAFEQLKDEFHTIYVMYDTLLKQVSHMRKQIHYLDSDINILFKLSDQERKKHAE